MNAGAAKGGHATAVRRPNCTLTIGGGSSRVGAALRRPSALPRSPGWARTVLLHLPGKKVGNWSAAAPIVVPLLRRPSWRKPRRKTVFHRPLTFPKRRCRRRRQYSGGAGRELR